MDPTYRNLTAVFTVGTVILWCLTNFLLTCDPDLDVAEQRNSYGKGAENKQGAVPITDDPSAREWLKSKLVESPRNRNMSPSSCRSTHGESRAAPFAAIAAVGELHLNLDVQEGGAKYTRAVAMLNSITSVTQGTDMIVSNLASKLDVEDKDLPEMFSGLKRLGFGLLSLGNLPSKQYNDAELHGVLKALEIAQIHWAGVGQGMNVVNERVVALNGQKVGFLAFCGIHGQCAETRERPLVPTRYESKLAAGAIEKLKLHGVVSIVVLVYWGQEHSYFPDESELVIARQLAEYGVTLVIGYHPQGVQDHAYFGKTLVLFSLGNVLTSDEEGDFCWNKLGDVWQYSDSDPCLSVHPRMRMSVRSREQITRVYKIGLSRSGVAEAKYTDLAVTIEASHPYIRRPKFNEDYRWTEVCSSSDTDCLACEPL